jgi:hypothetical protein
VWAENAGLGISAFCAHFEVSGLEEACNARVERSWNFSSNEDGANDACGGAKIDVTRGFLGHRGDALVIGEYVMK